MEGDRDGMEMKDAVKEGVSIDKLIKDMQLNQLDMKSCRVMLLSLLNRINEAASYSVPLEPVDVSVIRRITRAAVVAETASSKTNSIWERELLLAVAALYGSFALELLDVNDESKSKQGEATGRPSEPNQTT